MIFEPFALRGIQLSNRVVMSPLTRSRSIGNIPSSLVSEYYAQRATAGLIITEGTSPSPNGLGYPRIPGLFNAEHVAGWRLVTDAVHAQGGKIVVQLMHTGRVSHIDNLPAGATVMGPSSAVCPGEMQVDGKGPLPHTAPRAMTEDDIAATVQEYADAARLAIEAGFDGVELHAANGYVVTAEGRNRFVLEVARAAVAAIGADRVGIRLSPYGVVNAAGAYDGVDEQYIELVAELSRLGLLYVHVLDHSAMGTPPVPAGIKAALRAAFDGPFIAAGGFDKTSAERALTGGQADLVAFGRPFIANSDLVERLHRDAPLNAPDPATFYTPGAKGYTDYPTLAN